MPPFTIVVILFVSRRPVSLDFVSFLFVILPFVSLRRISGRVRRESTRRFASFRAGIIVGLYARGASMGGHTMGEVMYMIWDN